MKKAPILLSLGLALLLTACGGGEAESTPAQSAQARPSAAAAEPAAAPPEPAAYVLQTDGGAVAINDDMADVLSRLGEPKSYFEAASCAFEGLDKTYTYSGFVLTTRPDGDKDYVNSIVLTDDSVTTSEGLYIGCAMEEVFAVYGGLEDVDTLASYTKGGTMLNFIAQDGVVVSIEYLPV